MYRSLRPLLFRLDAERAHRLALRSAGVLERLGPLVAPVLGAPDERLRQSVFDVDFPGPVGLAAGFDKDASRTGAWHLLGFGFAEVGSVSARPSPGNPRPRAFRLLHDRALINRMGLNNEGAAAAADRLALRPPESRPIPIGVNVAKTHDPDIIDEAAIDDFAEAVRLLGPVADYLALNVSCPNTAEGKTFEDPSALDALLTRVRSVVSEVAPAVPLLVKVSPPPISAGGTMSFRALDELVEIATSHAVSGFIATNTTSDRVNLASDPATLTAVGAGGLSGAPLRRRALASVRRIFERTHGEIPIIGVGGIDSPESAYERIRAGASLIQVYTALVYGGPGLVRRINGGLLRLLERDGFEAIAEAIGADVPVRSSSTP